jgi:hypothetical protein
VRNRSVRENTTVPALERATHLLARLFQSVIIAVGQLHALNYAANFATLR